MYLFIINSMKHFAHKCKISEVLIHNPKKISLWHGMHFKHVPVPRRQSNATSYWNWCREQIDQYVWQFHEGFWSVLKVKGVFDENYNFKEFLATYPIFMSLSWDCCRPTTQVCPLYEIISSSLTDSSKCSLKFPTCGHTPPTSKIKKV